MQDPKATRPDWDLNNESFCCIPTCRDIPHDAAPQPMCARHLKEIYLFGQSLVDERWTEVLQQAQEVKTITAPPAVDIPGWVYFVRIGDLIKIGYSTYLKPRFKDLKPDEILALIPGTMADEKRCHVAFASARAHGEYFHPTPELLAFIADIEPNAA